MSAVNLKLQLLKNVAVADKPNPVLNAGTTILLSGDYHINTEDVVYLSSDLPAGSKIRITKPHNLTITLKTELDDVFNYEGQLDDTVSHDVSRELTLFKELNNNWLLFI